MPEPKAPQAPMIALDQLEELIREYRETQKHVDDVKQQMEELKEDYDESSSGLEAMKQTLVEKLGESLAASIIGIKISTPKAKAAGGVKARAAKGDSIAARIVAALEAADDALTVDQIKEALSKDGKEWDETKEKQIGTNLALLKKNGKISNPARGAYAKI